MPKKKKINIQIPNISDRFRINSSVEDDTDIFSPVSPDVNAHANGIDWLDLIDETKRFLSRCRREFEFFALN